MQLEQICCHMLSEANICLRQIRNRLDKDYHHTLFTGDEEGWCGHLWGCTQAAQGLRGAVRRPGVPV